MTCPRISPARELYGIIGTLPNASQLQAQWNRFFASHGMDAFMDKYPTTKANLPERLSEMFHFDRRLYLVGADLQEVIAPFLDVSGAERVDTIVNRGGVLQGMFLETTDPAAVLSALRQLPSTRQYRWNLYNDVTQLSSPVPNEESG